MDEKYTSKPGGIASGDVKTMDDLKREILEEWPQQDSISDLLWLYCDAVTAEFDKSLPLYSGNPSDSSMAFPVHPRYHNLSNQYAKNVRNFILNLAVELEVPWDNINKARIRPYRMRRTAQRDVDLFNSKKDAGEYKLILEVARGCFVNSMESDGETYIRPKYKK